MTEEPITDIAPETPDAGAKPPTQPRGRRPQGRPQKPQTDKAAGPPQASRIHPLLEQLAALYPQLFGAVFLPLKRGIFQDLMDAHPELMEREALKMALAQHTRSTRYLTSVAGGQQRHDLQGQPVEAMAPEHVYHALQEVFRRRQNRASNTEDLRPKLIVRIQQAYAASGLTPEAYAALVRSRDEAANALLDEALAVAAEQSAKDEALLRAFNASGQSSVAEFADMYGMDPRTVGGALERARRSAATKAA